MNRLNRITLAYEGALKWILPRALEWLATALSKKNDIWASERILLDFESAAINAFRSKFPNTTVRG